MPRFEEDIHTTVKLANGHLEAHLKITITSEILCAEEVPAAEFVSSLNWTGSELD